MGHQRKPSVQKSPVIILEENFSKYFTNGPLSCEDPSVYEKLSKGNLTTMKMTSRSTDMLSTKPGRFEHIKPAVHLTPELGSKAFSAASQTGKYKEVTLHRMPAELARNTFDDKHQCCGYLEGEEPVYMNQAMLNAERLKNLTKKHGSRVMKGLDLESNWDNV